MWPWTDPVREIIGAFLHRICSIFIENLDSEKLNDGLTLGHLTLTDLRFKKTTFNRLCLPVIVQEGYLGKFTISIPWKSLSSNPVEISIEDMYILLGPTTQTDAHLDDDEDHAQAIKAKKLARMESLEKNRATNKASAKNHGFVASLIMKVMRNLQFTVKNIHIRYEDEMERPERLLAAGISLKEFAAISVDETWKQAFKQSVTDTIRKLARLESLAIYLDTDTTSTAGLPVRKALNRLASLISSNDPKSMHQFIVQPVTGECRVTAEKEKNKSVLKTNVQFLFRDVGVSLDNNQYGGLIILVERYHLHLKRHKYRKDAPAQIDLASNRSRALFRFAGMAILHEIHKKNIKRTHFYIKKVGEQRRSYMALYRKKLLDQLFDEKPYLEAMERELGYEDIRFYRHLTRTQIRKDLKAHTIYGKKQREGVQTNGTSNSRRWSVAWLVDWLHGYNFSGNSGNSGRRHRESASFLGDHFWDTTDQQLRKLEKALDYDLAEDVPDTFVVDGADLQLAITLPRIYLTLKNSPPGGNGKNLISLVFTEFKADIIRRPFDRQVTLTLGGFCVHDGTTNPSAYPQVVRVHTGHTHHISKETLHREEGGDPLLYLNFKNKRLDRGAAHSLTFHLRRMEIIYHKACIEAIHQFLHPSGSSLESTEALLGPTIDILVWLRKKVLMGFNYTIHTRNPIDLKIDLNTPIIIIPENIHSKQSPHLIVDMGRITVDTNNTSPSDTHDSDAESKPSEIEDLKPPEDRTRQFSYLKLEAAQFLFGPDLLSCLDALESFESAESLHIIERLDMELQMQKFLFSRGTSRRLGLSKNPRIRISGILPRLQVNMSDTKYKAIKRFIDASVPRFANHGLESDSFHTRDREPNFFRSSPDFNIECDESEDQFDASDTDDEGFVETKDNTIIQTDEMQQAFKLDFQIFLLQIYVSKLNVEQVEEPLGELRLEGFQVTCVVQFVTMTVNLIMRSLTMTLKQAENDRIVLISSKHRGSETEEDFMTVANGLWDAFKTTFVPERSREPPPSSTHRVEGSDNLQRRPPWSNKIGITVEPASVHVSLDPASTLTLFTSNISVAIRANVIRVNILQALFAWAALYYWQILGKVFQT